MEKKSSISSKNNGSVGQFKYLNSNEMNNLRGGGPSEPPLPPPSGEDFLINIESAGKRHIPFLVFPAVLPRAASNSVIFD